MKSVFKVGDVKGHSYTVKADDIAEFENEKVHEVMSTFALSREMEWSSRLFVLEMIEDHEQGIGTFLEIKHKAPALVGQKLNFVARIEQLEGSKVICSVEVFNGERTIASGRTGQVILDQSQIEELFHKAKG